MQNLIKQLRTRKFGFIFSGVFFLLFVVLVAAAAIEGRWFLIFSGADSLFFGLLVWFVWTIHLMWLLASRPPVVAKRISPWLTIVGAVLILISAFKFAGLLAAIARSHEIQQAVDAGLQNDCARLLDNWPVKRDRLYSSDAEFAKLPPSIRLLSPGYVENSSYDLPDLPVNLGVCKNGFGGFAAGIRVFRSDEDGRKFISDLQKTEQINKDFGFQCISPGIYFWWQNT